MVEQTLEPPVVSEPPAVQPFIRNYAARSASVTGIVGLAFLAGVLALGVSTVITAATTPDFMVDDLSDDPFFGTGLASVVPLLLGLAGLRVSIAGVALVRRFGDKKIAIRALIFNIVNVLVPIGIMITMYNFDQLNAACGGG